MRILFFILMATALFQFSSCECGLGGKNDHAALFPGDYHGNDTEERLVPLGGGTTDFMFTHDATVEIQRVDCSTLNISIIVCHETDGKLKFDLSATIDSSTPDKFTIVDEPFLAGIVVPGKDIHIEAGKGEFSSDSESIMVTFKETRTNTADQAVEYESTHVITTNQVNTGSSGC